MSSLPRSFALLNRGQFVRGNMRSDHLPVGCVLRLSRALYRSSQIPPVVGLRVALLNPLAHRVERAHRCLRGHVSLVLGQVNYLSDQQLELSKQPPPSLVEVDRTPADSPEKETRRQLRDFIRRGYQQRLLIRSEEHTSEL